MNFKHAGAVGLLAALALAPAAIAQAPAAKPSVETTPISDLAANPALKAILTKDWPNFAMAPMDMIGSQSLRAVSAVPEADLTDAMLKTIQADFDALKS